MFYLLLAIISSVMVSFVMRLSTGKAAGSVSMLCANYLMCLLIAALFTGIDVLFPATASLPQTLGFGAVNGILYLVSFVLYQHSVKRCGIVLSSTFMKLGLLVPMVVSVLVFRDFPSAVQSVGFIIAIVAIILINTGGKNQAGSFSPMLFLILLTGGGANAMSEIFEEMGESALSSQFLFYTFLTAFVLCAGMMFIKKERPNRYSLLYGLMIGIPNYFSARFLLLSLQSVPAIIAHPTYSAVSVCLVCAIGVCIFKERLAKRQWLAMGIILIALILLNL